MATSRHFTRQGVQLAAGPGCRRRPTGSPPGCRCARSPARRRSWSGTGRRGRSPADGHRAPGIAGSTRGCGRRRSRPSRRRRIKDCAALRAAPTLVLVLSLTRSCHSKPQQSARHHTMRFESGTTLWGLSFPLSVGCHWDEISGSTAARYRGSFAVACARQDEQPLLRTDNGLMLMRGWWPFGHLKRCRPDPPTHHHLLRVGVIRPCVEQIWYGGHRSPFPALVVRTPLLTPPRCAFRAGGHAVHPRTGGVDHSHVMGSAGPVPTDEHGFLLRGRYATPSESRAAAGSSLIGPPTGMSLTPVGGSRPGGAGRTNGGHQLARATGPCTHRDREVTTRSVRAAERMVP